MGKLVNVLLKSFFLANCQWAEQLNKCGNMAAEHPISGETKTGETKTEETKTRIE